ncbi:hypothetical protein ACWIGW_16395 [Nocardia brasiliensis]
MGKIRALSAVLATAAGLIVAGSGLASAADAATPPVSTGSSTVIIDLVRALTTGSAGGSLQVDPVGPPTR